MAWVLYIIYLIGNTFGGATVANLTLEKGYFLTSNQSPVILPCYEENACQGGNDADK